MSSSGSNRYIGVYHPKPIKVHVERYDPSRKLVAETVRRERLVEAIAGYLYNSMRRKNTKSLRDAYR